MADAQKTSKRNFPFFLILGIKYRFSSTWILDVIWTDKIVRVLQWGYIFWFYIYDDAVRKGCHANL